LGQQQERGEDVIIHNHIFRCPCWLSYTASM